MLTRLVGAGLVLAMTPTAGAQDGTVAPPEQVEVEPIQIVRSITMDDLRFLLDDMGAGFIAAGRTGDGAPFVFGEFDDGLTFGAYAVCAGTNGDDCRGLELMAVYGSSASSDVISGIDRDYPAISLYKSDSQKVRVSRYVILDHGISWDNLLENANVFRMLCGKVSERLANLSEAETKAEWK
jgi:hypothetical protein